MPQFYKLLKSKLRHNGFTYKEGLNVDPVPFNPYGSCESGGLYYTDLEHMALWWRPFWPLVADVTVPDDACVYAEPCGTKWKADKLVLSNIRPLREFLNELGEDAVCRMLSTAPWGIECVSHQTEAMCLAAVRAIGVTLQHVETQTEAVCVAAVRNDGHALRFVNKQTEEICLAAVQRNGYALSDVHEPSNAVCLAAVLQVGTALQYVPVHKRTDALCLAAVQQAGYAIYYVPNQSEALCLAAVQQNGHALGYVYQQNQTEAVCRAAIAQYEAARRYVKIPYK